MLLVRSVPIWIGARGQEACPELSQLLQTNLGIRREQDQGTNQGGTGSGDPRFAPLRSLLTMAQPREVARRQIEQRFEPALRNKGQQSLKRFANLLPQSLPRLLRFQPEEARDRGWIKRNAHTAQCFDDGLALLIGGSLAALLEYAEPVPQHGGLAG